jgi:hypothetical protein
MRIPFRTVEFARVRASCARAVASLVLRGQRCCVDRPRAGFGRKLGPFGRGQRLGYEAPGSRRRSRSLVLTAPALALSP